MTRYKSIHYISLLRRFLSHKRSLWSILMDFRILRPVKSALSWARRCWSNTYSSNQKTQFFSKYDHFRSKKWSHTRRNGHIWGGRASQNISTMPNFLDWLIFQMYIPDFTGTSEISGPENIIGTSRHIIGTLG